MPGIIERLITNLFSKPINKAVRKQLTESENEFLVGVKQYGETDRDRISYDREDILDQCLDAWRYSPLGRRIVELTSQYVIGSGVDIKCSDKNTKKFLDEFWNHRLNRMTTRIVELCDELTRTGNLFVLISTDISGMSFIRVLPASDIDEIIPASNDIEQGISINTKAGKDLEQKAYPVYNETDDIINSEGKFETVVVQYSVNRPAGAQWGESDLAPLLKWLRRYSAWLEDRVRLNRFRNAFLYVVKGKFVSETARSARQTLLAANPPSSGSIMVCDESETWEAISPKLEAMDASKDGLAIKKLIAAGVGIPLHFLAEPEGTNRTTAESAGGPTFRRFEQRQEYFLWVIYDLLKIIIKRKSILDDDVKADEEIQVGGADLSARDNVSHSIAAVNILNGMERMYDLGLVSKRELMRVVYRFAGESIENIDDLMMEGTGIDNRESKTPIKPATADPVDVSSGTPKKSVLN